MEVRRLFPEPDIPPKGERLETLLERVGLRIERILSAPGSASGPYDQDAIDNPTPDTVTSSDVFSNFEAWEDATPEEHLNDVLETLSNWQIAHAGNQQS